MRSVGLRLALLAAASLGGVALPLEAQWRGAMAVEGRAFSGTPRGIEGNRHETAVTLRLEGRVGWDGGRQAVTVAPFLRWDPEDRDRTRFDFRELGWRGRRGDWGVAVGMREVFWGVTESQHPVDVLNQRELVAGGEGYVKLGQPMVQLTWTRSWGVVEGFLLAGLRTRSFAGRAGRLWSPLPVDAGGATFESASGAGHVDVAVRWSHTVGAWDLGVAHFRGTSREPRLLPGTDAQGGATWVPHYDLVDRTSVDLQLTTGSWLWKLEGARQAGAAGGHAEVAAGLEYAFADYFSAYAEYVYDSRGNRAATSFQDDLYVGARLLMYEGAISAGAYVDRATGNRLLTARATRRLTATLTVALDVQVFAGAPDREPRHAPRQDSAVGLRVSRFF